MYVAHHGVLKVSTPLLDYIRQRKEERIRIREEKKEERRRREADRRKIREEERRRPQKEAYSRDGGKEKGKVFF
jgi:regulator of nonsense transcripts 3